jgi:hypothetical protein
VRYYFLEHRSRSWPVTVGTIQKSEAVFQSSFFTLYTSKIPKSLFGYTYTVAGVRYVDFFAVVRQEDTQDAQGLQENWPGQT